MPGASSFVPKHQLHWDSSIISLLVTDSTCDKNASAVQSGSCPKGRLIQRGFTMIHHDVALSVEAR
jgi:hypothetical protein